MTTQQFLIKLGLVSVVIAGLILLMGAFSQDWSAHLKIGFYLQFFYICLYLPTFMIAKKAAQSTNKQLFTGIIMLSVLLKLVVSITVVFWYHKVFHPQGPLFLLPFFLVYIIYTIFESQFMIKLGKNDTKRETISTYR